MYLDHPSITATRSDTEPDRLERLNRVYGYVIGQADLLGNKECIDKISRMHDDKGCLRVTWLLVPTELEKALFARAWLSQVGDGSSQVVHQLVLD